MSHAITLSSTDISVVKYQDLGCSKYEMFVWLIWYLSIEYKILNIGYIKLSDIVEKSGVIYWFVVLLLKFL